MAPLPKPAIEFPITGMDKICISVIFDKAAESQNLDQDESAYMFWENEFGTRQHWIFQGRMYEFHQHPDNGFWYPAGITELRRPSYAEIVDEVQRLPVDELEELRSWVYSELDDRARARAGAVLVVEARDARV